MECGVNGEAGETVHVHAVEDINRERAPVLILNQMNIVLSILVMKQNTDDVTHRIVHVRLKCLMDVRGKTKGQSRMAINRI